MITVDTIMLCYCEDMKKNGTDGVAEGAIGNKASAEETAAAETTVVATEEVPPAPDAQASLEAASDMPPDAPEE